METQGAASDSCCKKSAATCGCANCLCNSSNKCKSGDSCCCKEGKCCSAGNCCSDKKSACCKDDKCCDSGSKCCEVTKTESHHGHETEDACCAKH
ncbi:hypothetical protein GWI33_021847 [Rhynchophorus ferrugineus]|uniref:Uncharacterized protein n=1 Tax=Rhynchophorus ferrugineus TaxID=354439 RepID=A0A834IVG7_RHYFE|nr:hypothetical protein GWI33_021847 [Rhynchophorus ferrugineus]